MSFIDEFESHYDYDCNYMRVLERTAPKAFEAFVNFLPMGRIGESIPSDILWTAKISAMLVEDCGACVQLNIKMALESGVPAKLLKQVVQTPSELEGRFMQVYKFANMVAAKLPVEEELYEKMKKDYSETQLSELSIAIASTKVYPTIKRSLGEFQSCALMSFEF